VKTFIKEKKVKDKERRTRKAKEEDRLGTRKKREKQGNRETLK